MKAKRFILMLLVMLGSVTGAWAETVSYIDFDGTSKSVDATVITSSSGTLNAGWYVVLGDDVQTSTLVCEGDVHLILADGKKLTARGSINDAGIRVSADGASLTIYGQQNQTGQLIATGYALCAGIGGTEGKTGHDITINGGVITAKGGALASAIGSGREGSGSSNIFVNSSLALYADGNNPPATIINHATATDVSGSLNGKPYAIVRVPVNGITVTLDKQGGTGGNDQIVVNEGEDMPTIEVPTREGYSFQGYYAGENGTGTKYYNPDGTSAHLWDFTVSTTLYAYWIPNSIVTLDPQGGNGGTPQITVIYDTPMPAITIPTRDGLVFQGYYAGENGTGTMYYNPDGTSAHLCDLTENTTLFAFWKQAVSYIDAEGTEKYVGVYDEITNTTTTLTAGWYIVRGEDVKTGTLVCEGAVHIILADEAKLTATGGIFDAGIRVSADGASLTIYVQSEQTGQLIANGGHSGAGIGGGNNSDGHDITINGGVITATGGYSASGIGGGKFGESSNIFVNTSMVVKANNNEESAIFIDHTTNEDISQSLAGKQYVIIRTVVESTITLDKQDGIDGDDQVTATLGSGMPAIAVPHRDGYTFRGYYTGQNGSGIKYYNHEGNGVRPCELTENSTLYAFWSQPISYIDADGTSKEVSDYEVISNTSTTLSAGWYVVCDEDVQTGELICEGNVHLILADDAKLTTRGGENHAGVRVSAEGASLAIYGQSKQTGQLIATGGSRGAGIGGSDWEKGHDITINGGMITATGGYGAAGIGAGNSSVGHKITIRSGKVIATGGTGGAGIGGSRYMSGYDIAITGGVVIATGGANASCIGAGEISSNRSHDIYVHDTLVLKADTQNPPVAIISHAIHTDIATDLFGKQYAMIYSPGPLTVTLDKQEGIGGSDNVTATYGKTMPTITAPMRDGYCFHGYYSGKDGTGTKYYNLDGTSAHLWDKIESATLYALWGNHTYDITAEQGSVAYFTCNVCGYIDPVRQHVHHYVASEVTTEGHVYVCTSEVGECTVPEIRGGHTLEVVDGTYVCSLCGWRHEHNYNYMWIHDETKHWHECDGEGECNARTKDEAAHSYDNTATAGTVPYYTCSVCGHIDPVRQHVHNYEWVIVDEHQHKQVCTSEVGTCQEREKNVAIHIYHDLTFGTTEYYTCDICQYVDETRKAQFEARDYMSMTAVGGDVKIGVDLYPGAEPDYVIQYSKDRVNWSDYAVKNNNIFVTIRSGETYYFRSGMPELLTGVMDENSLWNFTMEGNGTIEAGGNVMSLLDRSCQSLTVGKDGLSGLFYECTPLTVAPELPATELNECCYYAMFCECTKLRKAPHLPAKTIKYDSYSNMFYGCSSLDYVEADFTEAQPGGTDPGEKSKPFYYATETWLNGTAPNGIIVLKREMIEKRFNAHDGINIPNGWKRALKVKTNEDPDHRGNFYTTFYDNQYSFNVIGDAKAYSGSIEGDELRLTTTNGNVIPKGDGVLLHGPSAEIVLAINGGSNRISGNVLTGSDTDTTAPDFCYILSYGQQRLGFYKYEEGKALSAHKAYLIYGPHAAPAKALRMVFVDDDVDGIESISSDSANSPIGIYSVSGVRLNKLQKGINIVNGKKVIIK